MLERQLNEAFGLGPVFYHCTRASTLKSIMRYGLDPKYMSDYGNEEPQNFIFLTRSFAQAKAMKELFIPRVPSAVLAVQPPPSLVKQFVFDQGEFIRVPVLIPSQYLKVVWQDKVIRK